METKELYYKKHGRRYIPVAYDLPHFYADTATLVMSDKNCTSYIHNVDPDTVHIRLASELAVNRVVKIVANACEAELCGPTDEKLAAAWKAYCDVLGDDRPLHINCGSHYDVAKRIVDAMFELAREIESASN